MAPVENKIYIFFITVEEDKLYHFKALANDGTYLPECGNFASENSAKLEMTSRLLRHYPKHRLAWKGGPIDLATPDRPEIKGAAQFFQAFHDDEFRQALG